MAKLECAGKVGLLLTQNVDTIGTDSVQWYSYSEFNQNFSAIGGPGRAKVARTVEVDDGRGGKVMRQLDDFGGVVGSDMAAYIPPVQVNQGDRVTFQRPTAGLNLPVNMSPSERDASARGWAGQKLARERFTFDQGGGANGIILENADRKKSVHPRAHSKVVPWILGDGEG